MTHKRDVSTRSQEEVPNLYENQNLHIIICVLAWRTIIRSTFLTMFIQRTTKMQIFFSGVHFLRVFQIDWWLTESFYTMGREAVRKARKLNVQSNYVSSRHLWKHYGLFYQLDANDITQAEDGCFSLFNLRKEESLTQGYFLRQFYCNGFFDFCIKLISFIQCSFRVNYVANST